MRETDRPTLGQIIEEIADLSAGIGVVMLPLFLMAVPGVVLFVVLPALLLLAVAAAPAALAAVVAAPVLLGRFLLRRRGRAP